MLTFVTDSTGSMERKLRKGIPVGEKVRTPGRHCCMGVVFSPKNFIDILSFWIESLLAL